MSKFDLNIERYYEQKKQLGYELKAIAHIQYPIYCIHAIIWDSTPDPLENLDISILRCTLITSGISNSDVSQILSIQKKAVDLRIEKLKEDGLLKPEKKLQITDKGKEIIVSGKQKRLSKKSHDFYIDGIDFSPLKKELYYRKYTNSFYSENDYLYFTDKYGNTQTNKPFRPNIVHEPIEKEKIIEKILSIDSEERGLYDIPKGLEKIEKVDFTKMSIPILVGLSVKKNKIFKDLIDGFSVSGDIININHFYPKIKDRIEDLEVNLDIREEKISFSSNWNEIDSSSGKRKRIYFITKDDLKVAFKKYYNIPDIDDNNIINTDYEIGINITKDFIHNLNDGYSRRRILDHLIRGRDYSIFSGSHGVWLIFIQFRTDCPYIKSLLMVFKFLKDANKKNLNHSQIRQKVIEYENYREFLILIGEFGLLEDIDMRQNMYYIENE